METSGRAPSSGRVDLVTISRKNLAISPESMAPAIPELPPAWILV
jgi:hypothetical protein